MKLLDRLDPGLGRRVAVAERRHAAAILVVGLFVAAFVVERQEAGEEHDLAGRAQRRPPRPVAQLDRRPLEPRRGHLAGQRAVVDQLVEPRMVARPGAGAVEIGRPDRLVRFLRVLDLARDNGAACRARSRRRSGRRSRGARR